MQRIFNVDKWTVVEPGHRLDFPGERARQVRLECNSQDVSNLYLIDAEGEVFFLARVCGRDTIEFVSGGKFSISVADGPCSIYTVDGTTCGYTVEAPESFTRIVERRVRNPEQEYMMNMMMRNMEKRLASQAGELREQYDRREREREARRVAAAAASRNDAARAVPAVDTGGDAASSATPAGRAKRSGTGEAAS